VGINRVSIGTIENRRNFYRKRYSEDIVEMGSGPDRRSFPATLFATYCSATFRILRGDMLYRATFDTLLAVGSEPGADIDISLILQWSNGMEFEDGDSSEPQATVEAAVNMIQ